MRNLNSILLEGSLLDDPVLGNPSTPDAPPRCTFSLSSDPNPSSVPVLVFGRLAAFCAKHLFQGSVVRVVGRIAQDTQASSATGTFRLCIVAEHIEPKPSNSKPIPAEAADVGF